MDKFPFDPYDFFAYLAVGLLALVGLELVFGVPKVMGQDLNALDTVLAVLGAYVLGQVLANPSQWILEDGIVGGLLGRPSVNLMRAGPKKPWRRFIFPTYYERLPEETQRRVLQKARAEGLEDVKGETLFVHVRFRDYMRTDSVLMGRLDAFLNKYGFNRNLCFVALVFGVAVLVVHPFDVASNMTRYGLLLLAAAVLLFYRYLKFFRQYSYELFNSYAGRPHVTANASARKKATSA